MCLKLAKCACQCMTVSHSPLPRCWYVVCDCVLTQTLEHTSERAQHNLSTAIFLPVRAPADFAKKIRATAYKAKFLTVI